MIDITVMAPEEMHVVGIINARKLRTHKRIRIWSFHLQTFRCIQHKLYFIISVPFIRAQMFRVPSSSSYRICLTNEKHEEIRLLQ